MWALSSLTFVPKRMTRKRPAFSIIQTEYVPAGKLILSYTRGRYNVIISTDRYGVLTLYTDSIEFTAIQYFKEMKGSRQTLRNAINAKVRKDKVNGA